MNYRHVLAGVLACGLFAAGLTSAGWYVRSLEQRHIGALAPRMFDLKNQGSQLQTEAFRHPELLVVYGSSELDMPNPYHASTLFETYPTGFTIFPVGRGSTTSLVILQDVAAVGSEMRGKKVVVSLSPPWFFLHDRTPDFYMSNHSALHVSALVFSTELSFETKQRAVRQLMQSPKLFAGGPLVSFAAQRLAEDSLLSRLQYMAALPLGKLQTSSLQLQDLWATYSFVTDQESTESDSSRRDARGIDWPAVMNRAELEQIGQANNNELGFDNEIWSTKYARLVIERRGKFSDEWFVDNLTHTAEFVDLDILLGGLVELGAEPLLITQPIPGKYYDVLGISASARALYYARLRDLAAAHSVPIVDFEDHDNDIYFVTDPNSHLSRKGWVYYGRALDAFYHGSLGELARTEWRASALLPGDIAGLAAALR